MTTIDRTNGATTRTIQPDDTGSTATGSTAAIGGALLPDPLGQLMSSGDVGAVVAALVIQSGTTDKRVHDALRSSEEAAEDKAAKEGVDAMRDQAHLTRVGAFVGGLGTISAAAVSCAGLPPDATKQQAKGAEVASGGVKGLADAGKGLADAAVANARADGADADRRAGRAKSNAQDESDRVRAANDLIQKALDFYKAYLSVRDQTAGAALHRA